MAKMQKVLVTIVGTASKTPTFTRCWIPREMPPYGLLYRPTIEIEAESAAPTDSDLQKQMDAIRESFEKDGWTDVNVTYSLMRGNYDH
jgi:hypothetical protein